MRRRALLAAGFVAGSAAACSLLVDTGGLVGKAARGADAGADGVADRDVGVTEGGGSDAPGNDGALAAQPCPPFALFCDDFETGSLAKWQVETPNGGTTIVDTVLARRGARSLYARVLASVATDAGPINSGARARAPIGAAKKSGLLATRSWIYLPAELEGDTTILKLRAASGPSDINLKVHTNKMLAVDADTPGSGSIKVGSRAPPVQRWFCLEWRVTIGAAGHVMVALDGETIVDADENTEVSSGFGEVAAGFTPTGHGSDGEVRFDDFAIADQPIACP